MLHGMLLRVAPKRIPNDINLKEIRLQAQNMITILSSTTYNMSDMYDHLMIT